MSLLTVVKIWGRDFIRGILSQAHQAEIEGNNKRSFLWMLQVVERTSSKKNISSHFVSHLRYFFLILKKYKMKKENIHINIIKTSS